MLRMHGRIVVGALLALASVVSHAQQPSAEPGNLNQLLEQTRTLREREAQQNKEREARFVAERNQQAQLLAQAKAELAELQRRSASLSVQFDSNEKKLTELEAELERRSGVVGEMFGVVRQVANDFSSIVRNSMVSAQYPDREAFIVELSQTSTLPSITTLQRFWFELQREMTETGTVSRFNGTVVMPDGASTKGEIVRIGPFMAVADGKYLTYLPSQKVMAEMAAQPGGKFVASAAALQAAKDEYVGVDLDPTRGVMLAIYSQRPSWIDRIKHGEHVNYVILLVGIIGALLGVFQFAYLLGVRNKVHAQLKDIAQPNDNNPLGRVLATFKGDAKSFEEDASVVELRISEAVLREVPNLERFQSFLRLAVAAGPLLGLIGTVIGMIITFQTITESGSSDPKLMAAGISAAMIATVLGLGIAIPLLFINAWLTSMSRSLVQILDEQSTGLLASRLEGKGHV